MDSLFGMGILLDYIDNMTPGLLHTQTVFNQTQYSAQQMVNGINQQLQRLQNIAISGMTMSQLGMDLMNAGSMMIKPLIDVGKQLVTVNSKFDTLGATFKTAFGADAQSKMAWVANFAIKTPFQVENTARALVGLKNTGLDATKTFKDANGQLKPFLQFAGDLATLNMGQGGGIDGMLIAIRNAASAAPGGLRSLQTRFDIPKVEIAKLAGKTGDAFMEEFAKIAVKLTPNAMVNMIGTWDQIISEMKDTWDVFLWNIGKNGAFNDIKRTLHDLSMVLSKSLDQDSARAFSQIISSLWKPIDMAVKGLTSLVVSLKDLIVAHPIIGKFIVSFLAFAGATLAVTGVMMKLVGGLMIATASIGTFLILLHESTITMSIVKGAFRSFFMSIIPLVALFGGIYVAWRYDLFNLRTSVTSFFGHVKDSFADARRIVGLNSAGMRQAFIDLDMKNDFFSGLTKALVRLHVLWTGLVDSWNDNTLSEENFAKLRGLGLLPVIESILDMKMRSEEFFKGFKTGTEEAVSVIKPFVEWIGELIVKVTGLADPTKKFNEETDKLNLDRWRYLGEVIGATVTILIAVKLGIMIVSGVLSTLIGVVKIATFVFKAFSLVLRLSPMGIAITLIAGLVAIGITLYKNWDTVSIKLSDTWAKITNIFRSGVNQVRGPINDLIEAFNRITGASLPTIPEFEMKMTHAEQIKNAQDSGYTDNWTRAGYNARGTDYWRGGLTWVGEEGPELINLNRGAQVIPNDRITVSNSQSSIPSQRTPSVTQNDYSINFDKESIVIHYQGGGSKEDAQDLAETIMKQIERKQQMKRIANYQLA